MGYKNETYYEFMSSLDYKNGSLYNPTDGWVAGSIEGSDAHLFMAILWKNPITGVIEWPKYPNI